LTGFKSKNLTDPFEEPFCIYTKKIKNARF
jgi:hypothetical protein